MAKTYRVIVNGEAFEVEVEEIGGVASVCSVNNAAAVNTAPAVQAAAPTPAPAAAAAAPTPAPAAAPAPAPTPAPAKASGSSKAPNGAVPVVSPLPGKVLAIKVAEGQKVAKGDLLLLIEAMKMENEIFAAHAGTVVRLHATVGQNVETGAKLLDIAVGG